MMLAIPGQDTRSPSVRAGKIWKLYWPVVFQFARHWLPWIVNGAVVLIPSPLRVVTVCQVFVAGAVAGAAFASACEALGAAVSGVPGVFVASTMSGTAIVGVAVSGAEVIPTRTKSTIVAPAPIRETFKREGRRTREGLTRPTAHAIRVKRSKIPKIALIEITDKW